MLSYVNDIEIADLAKPRYDNDIANQFAKHLPYGRR